LLILMDKWHFYLEKKSYAGGGPTDMDEIEIFASTLSDAKRGDLIRTYAEFNTQFSDLFIELRNSVNSRATKEKSRNDFAAFERTNNLTAPKSEFLRGAKRAVGVDRKPQGQEFLRIWNTMPAAQYTKTNNDIKQKQRQLLEDAMDGKFDDRFQAIGKVAVGFSRLDGVLSALEKQSEEFSKGGGFQTDSFKVAGMKEMAEELGVDISNATKKIDIAAALHESLTRTLGEGGCFKYMLERSGKSMGGENAVFWEEAARQANNAKSSAAVAMDSEEAAEGRGAAEGGSEGGLGADPPGGV